MPAAVAIAKGWPALRQLIELWRSGYGTVTSPSALLSGTCVALVGFFTLAGLARDAGWDRRVPDFVLLAAIVCALLPLGRLETREVDSALRRCGAMLARQLHVSGDASLPPGCERPLFRDRWLRPVPTRLLEMHDAAAPIREPPTGGRPGTLVVARKGELGWVTAVGLGSAGPAMVRSDDAPWIAGFTKGGMR